MRMTTVTYCVLAFNGCVCDGTTPRVDNKEENFWYTSTFANVYAASC